MKRQRIPFPGVLEKFLREVAAYRGATPQERLQAAFELSDLCEAILAASPSRDAQIRLLDENEEAERRSWIGFLTRHAAEKAP